MPDRIVRDELLGSERWWGISDAARTMFVSIMLTADDAGRLSGAPFALRSRLMAGTVDAAKCEELLAELVAVDLVRSYDVDGKRYLFVPRFRNRKRYVSTSKFPVPPSHINDITEKKADSSHPQDTPETDLSNPKVSPKSRGVGWGRGGVGLKALTTSLVLSSNDSARENHEKPVDKKEDPKTKTVSKNPTLAKNPTISKNPTGNGHGSSAWWKTDAGIMSKAVELNVPPRVGETYAERKRRLFDAQKNGP